MRKVRYKGFSTKHTHNSGTFLLTDVDLVKEDILNHIFTTTGERVMSDRGTILAELVFEHLDDDMVEEVDDEVRRVIESDPRVALLSMATNPDYDRLMVVSSIVLRYIELNVTEEFDLNIQFETAE